MTQEYKDALISSGVDFKEAMNRLMNNEEIYETLVEMFLEDTSLD